MKRIWDAKGVAVVGLENRTGKRFLESESEQRGGARQSDPTKDRIAVIHEDAEDAVDEMLASAEEQGEREEQGEEQEEEDLLIEEEINDYR